MTERGVSFVCWVVAEKQAQDRVNTATGEVRRVEKKSEAELFFHELGNHGNTLNHSFTKTLCFSKSVLQELLSIAIILLNNAASYF